MCSPNLADSPRQLAANPRLVDFFRRPFESLRHRSNVWLPEKEKVHKSQCSLESPNKTTWHEKSAVHQVDKTPAPLSAHIGFAQSAQAPPVKAAVNQAARDFRNAPRIFANLAGDLAFHQAAPAIEAADSRSTHTEGPVECEKLSGGQRPSACAERVPPMPGDMCMHVWLRSAYRDSRCCGTTGLLYTTCVCMLPPRSRGKFNYAHVRTPRAASPRS